MKRLKYIIILLVLLIIGGRLFAKCEQIADVGAFQCALDCELSTISCVPVTEISIVDGVIIINAEPLTDYEIRIAYPCCKGGVKYYEFRSDCCDYYESQQQVVCKMDQDYKLDTIELTGGCIKVIYTKFLEQALSLDYAIYPECDEVEVEVYGWKANPADEYFYEWFDGSTEDVRYFTKSGSYGVTCTDSDGCTKDLRLEIEVEPCIEPESNESEDIEIIEELDSEEPRENEYETPIEKVNFYSPNAFSPNDDGINDKYKVFCNCEILYFTVFDRWGNELYEGLEWDSSYRGKYVMAGNYVVAGHYVTNGEPRFFKQEITLLR